VAAAAPAPAWRRLLHLQLQRQRLQRKAPLLQLQLQGKVVFCSGLSSQLRLLLLCVLPCCRVCQCVTISACFQFLSPEIAAVVLHCCINCLLIVGHCSGLCCCCAALLSPEIAVVVLHCYINSVLVSLFSRNCCCLLYKLLAHCYSFIAHCRDCCSLTMNPNECWICCCSCECG
jgi:hypothetical protein